MLTVSEPCSLATTPAGPADDATDWFGTDRTVFQFRGSTTPSQQGGLVFDAAGLDANSYSVALTFKFNERQGGWRRILDTSGRASDNGFYVNTGNNLAVFPTAGSNVNFVNGVYRNAIRMCIFQQDFLAARDRRAPS